MTRMNFRHQELRQKTSAALTQLGEADTSGPVELSPQLGDLWVLPQTAATEVEWAVISVDPHTQQLLIVPADTQPLVGSEDVSVPDEAPGGPLSLRCGHGVWVPPDLLDPLLRTGRLGQESLLAAQALRVALERGAAPGTLRQHEVDRSPEYQDWIEAQVRQARDLLLVSFDGAFSARSTAPPLPFRPPEGDPRPDQNRGLPEVLGLAAAALLTVGVVFASGWFWQEQTKRELEARLSGRANESARQHQETVALLERERVLRQEQAQQDQARLQSAEAALKIQQQLQASSALPPDPPFVILSPEGVSRGETAIFEVDNTGDPLLLLLLVDVADLSYRLEIRQQSSDKLVYQAAIRKRSLSEILVQIPPGLLERDSYRLLLFGRQGQEKLLHQYSLTVKTP